MEIRLYASAIAARGGFPPDASPSQEDIREAQLSLADALAEGIRAYYPDADILAQPGEEYDSIVDRDGPVDFDDPGAMLGSPADPRCLAVLGDITGAIWHRWCEGRVL